MIVILKAKTEEKEVERLIKELEKLNVSVDKSQGIECTILGLVGDTSKIDPWRIESENCVEKVMKVQEPYKKANRAFHPENTVIDVCGRKIGGKKIAMIAGPCSVESEEQIILVANEVKKHGAGFLRGGAFKPRTSPYSFQGLKYEGLD
ncbi:MAG: 3-deoxy-7-phosphoheptulonate synthase, partial [Clostridium sp.]|nr:3-deoxy-7-phosphoheptulonate synthase [Clostridium sp.]